MFKTEGQPADAEKEGRQGTEQAGRAKRMREQVQALVSGMCENMEDLVSEA